MFEIILAGIKAKAPVVLEATLRTVGIKLLGKALELPEVWLDGKIQVLRDKTEARSMISRAIASEAAKLAVADAEFLKTAVDTVLLDYNDKFANRAAVYKGALEVVCEASPKEQATAQVPEEDWLNAFSRYAEDASSARMQETFSRILAGEILAKGTFSRTAMRVMYEMTPETASAFSEVWLHNIGGCVPRIYKLRDYDRAVALSKEKGFLHNDVRCFVSEKLESDDENVKFCELVIGKLPNLRVAYKEENSYFEMSESLHVEAFTEVGLEIASILPMPDIENNLRSLVEHLPQMEKVHQIRLVHIDGSIEELAFPPQPN